MSRRDDVVELKGNRVTDRIGDVDRGRTGINHSFDHFRQELQASTDGILTGEFNIGGI